MPSLIHASVPGLNSLLKPDLPVNRLTESSADNIRRVRIVGWQLRGALVCFARRALHLEGPVALEWTPCESSSQPPDEGMHGLVVLDLEQFDDAMRGLTHASPEAAGLLEMRLFCGLSVCESIQALTLGEAGYAARWKEGWAHMRRILIPR